MRKVLIGSVTLSTALLISSFVSAADAPIQPMQLGDSRMTCDQLITEAQNMEQVIGGAPAGGLFSSEQAINASTGLAQRAAISAGAGQLAGGLGVVGGAFKGLSNRKKKKQEEERALAERRWFYVVGLYGGNKCDQQENAASEEAVPAAE